MTRLGTMQLGSGSKVFGNQKFNPNLNQNPNPNLRKKRDREAVGELMAAITTRKAFFMTPILRRFYGTVLVYLAVAIL